MTGQPRGLGLQRRGREVPFEDLGGWFELRDLSTEATLCELRELFGIHFSANHALERA